MTGYATRRLAQLVPTLLGMSLLIFGLVRLLPGDVTVSLFGGDSGSTDASRDAVRQALGLDKPLPVQYWDFLKGFFDGNLGKSFLSGQPVAQIIGHAIPITLELTLLAMLMAVVVGIPLGVLSAAKKNSGHDLVARVGGLLGLSIPNFWVATLLLLATSAWFGWVPPVTFIPFWSDPLGNLEQMAIPAFSLALYPLATVMRMTRASLLEVLREDYVRTARAKGHRRRDVVIHHALRNSMIPVVTVVGLQIGNLMGGATIIEVIFGLPGVGNTLVGAIYNRDYPIIQVASVFLATVFVLVNLAVDLLYGVIDPRIEQA
jgi:peptide/nickel transport system permease protein